MISLWSLFCIHWIWHVMEYITHIVTNNIQIIYYLFCKSFNILFAVSGKPSHDPQHPNYIPTRFGEQSDRKTRQSDGTRMLWNDDSRQAHRNWLASVKSAHPRSHKVPLAASMLLSTPVLMLPALTPPCLTPTTPQANVCSTPVETAAVPVNDVSDVPF